MSGGEGQALVGKWGWVLDGGIDHIFANWGTPSPPREKTLPIKKSEMFSQAIVKVNNQPRAVNAS